MRESKLSSQQVYKLLQPEEREKGKPSGEVNSRIGRIGREREKLSVPKQASPVEREKRKSKS